jgi:phage host-nuclease inhibitor protein Gam
MAIEKVLGPLDLPDDDREEEIEVDEIEIDIVNPDAVAIEDEDGGMIIDFSGKLAEEIMGAGHDSNLAEFLDDSDLKAMAAELVGDFMNDRTSREDWARAYVKGLDLLGMKVEDRTIPWQGASGVFHPVLTEAVVRFQAQAMGELCPASGPAKTKIMGRETPELQDQAVRIETELNYQITEEMTEYRDEMEQLLFRTALAGSGFKKVYYDPVYDRPCAMFVPAEDMVVGYGATDLQRCERYTHVMKKTANEIAELQYSGFYREVELPAPSQDITDIQEKYNEMMGVEEVLDDDDRHTILEMHVTMNMPEEYDDMDGIARPYIVTIDKSSRTILSIRKNWNEDDPKKRKLMHFVHYKYLPGLGFYGLGLIHLIGGLAKTATSVLRQLIDAGTLANLPAGFKAKGMRITGDNTPLMPGEFRDVDVPGGSIRDALHPLPYKEPSQTLYSLLGNVVEEARRIGSIADVQMSNMNAQAPVGTTLALLERTLKVMSGVQARMHNSLKQELRLIARVIHDFMGPEYSYDPEGKFNRTRDFDGRVDVIPVSDPNAATMAQRVVQYQTALQLAQQAPQLYNMGKLHREMLEVLNIKDADEIVKLPGDIKPMDPVTENMAMLKQEPVKAFMYQDHEAHIRVHMSAMQDPKIQQVVGQSPFAAAIQSAAAAHITEHVAMQYRVEIQKKLGVELPDPEANLPEDIEREVSRLAAEAADKLLRQNQAQAAQMAAQQAERDPLTQIQRAELELEGRRVALEEAKASHQALVDKEKLEIERLRTAGNLQVQEDRLEAENQRTAAQIGARLATQLDQNQSKERMKGVDIGLKVAENIIKGGERGAAGDTEAQN